MIAHTLSVVGSEAIRVAARALEMAVCPIAHRDVHVRQRDLITPALSSRTAVQHQTELSAQDAGTCADASDDGSHSDGTNSADLPGEQGVLFRQGDSHNVLSLPASQFKSES